MTARLLILLPSPPQPWPCRQYCLHRWRSMILMLTQSKLINEEQDEAYHLHPHRRAQEALQPTPKSFYYSTLLANVTHAHL
ncbi:hypothetical protein FCV25MIE_29676 [Fagus crenata]